MINNIKMNYLKKAIKNQNGDLITKNMILFKIKNTYRNSMNQNS